MFDTHIEYNELLVLKQREVEKLKTLLQSLAETVESSSEMQMLLSVKSRALEKSERERVLGEQRREVAERRVKRGEEEILHLKQIAKQHE